MLTRRRQGSRTRPQGNQGRNTLIVDMILKETCKTYCCEHLQFSILAGLILLSLCKRAWESANTNPFSELATPAQ